MVPHTSRFPAVFVQTDVHSFQNASYLKCLQIIVIPQINYRNHREQFIYALTTVKDFYLETKVNKQRK